MLSCSNHIKLYNCPKSNKIQTNKLNKMKKFKNLTGRFRSVIQQVLVVVFSCCSLFLYGQKDFYDCFLIYTEQKYGEAANCLTSILESNPKDFMALYQRYHCYRWLDQNDDAINDISKAIKYHNKKDKFYTKDKLLVDRAQIYYSIGNYKKALKDYAAAQKINPKNIDVYFDRANLYYLIKNYDASDYNWNAILKLDKKEGAAIIGLTRNMLAKKEWDKAIEALDELEKKNNQYSLLYKYRTQAYFEKGEYSKAIDDAIDYIYYDNWESEDSYFYLFKFYTLDPDYLLEKFNEQIEKDLDYKSHWLFLRAGLYSFMEQYTDALEDYNNIALLYLDDKTELYRIRGDIYILLGEYDKAIADFEEVIKSRESYILYIRKGDAEWLKANYHAAIAEFSKSIELNPNFFLSYYQRGWVKEFINDYNGALDDYNMTIELEPSYAYTYFARGVLYKKILDEPQLAEADFNTVLTLEQNIKQSGSCRQYALLHLDRIDEAIAYQKEIIEKYPTNGNYYDAACLYSYLNRQSEAIESLNKSFEKGNRDFIKCEHDRYLENIRNNPEFERLIKKWKTENKD